MKISEACTGVFTCENDTFKFSKTAKSTKSTCITCTIVPVLADLFNFSDPVGS